LYASGPALLPVLEEYASLIAAGDVSQATRLFAEKVAQFPTEVLGAIPPDAGELAELIGCLHDLEAMAFDQTDITRWGGIDVPTLLMQGAQSWPPIPSTMEQLATALPAAGRAVLEGQSHFATHTAPELFAEKLLQFLHEHSG
jgi:pimeloyl-ACP methyl ester carboxylesterase